MHSLNWHMRSARRFTRALQRDPLGPLPADGGGETVGLEETVALQRRVTGADHFAVTDGIDVAEAQRMYEAFAEQTLQHGDWGIAYLGALGRNGGDRDAADEEMRRAFGRTVSARYARALLKRWEADEEMRRREAARFREAFPQMPPELRSTP